MSFRGLSEKICPCVHTTDESEAMLEDSVKSEEEMRKWRKIAKIVGAVVAAVSAIVIVIVLIVVLTQESITWKPMAYVTSVNKLSVIDPGIKNVSSVSTTLAIGTYSYGIAITPDGKQAWAISDTNILIIDTRSHQLIDTISEIPGAILLDIAITPNGKEVYVSKDSTVLVIDTQTREVIAYIPVNPYPYAIAITLDGKWVCVTNFASNTVSLIDTEAKIVTATISVDNPMSIIITANGEETFVSSTGNVFVINIKNQTVNATILVDENDNLLRGMAMTLDSRWLYVANEENQSIAVIETKTKTLNATIPIPSPTDVALTLDDKQIYVASADGNVYIMDASTLTMVGKIPIGTNPYTVTIALVAQ
jgi:YVTN family beta-propeller protein